MKSSTRPQIALRIAFGLVALGQALAGFAFAGGGQVFSDLIEMRKARAMMATNAVVGDLSCAANSPQTCAPLLTVNGNALRVTGGENEAITLLKQGLTRVKVEGQIADGTINIRAIAPN